MASSSQKLHIVAVSFPAQGHLPGILHLCTKLAARGIIVTVVNIDSIHEQLLKQWTCPPGVDIRLEAIPFEVSIPAGYDAACNSKSEEFRELVKTLQGPFELLLEKLEPPVSCILGDEILSWSDISAKKLGIPFSLALYWPGNAAWSSFHHHLSLIVSNGDLPLKDEDSLVSYVPGLSPIRAVDLPDYMLRADKDTLDLLAKSFHQMTDAKWVLVHSFYELEPYTFDAMKQAIGSDRYLSVGPLFPVTSSDLGALNTSFTSLRAEDNTCLQWLDTQAASSVLYISFGSISTLSRAEFEELACGLEASSQPFLWAVRPDTVQDEADNLYKQFSERTKDHGLFVSWAPQLKVLAHPSIGGFLTHCGWNSTLESIAHGVPMLGWPCFCEQRMNCKLIEQDWQIGLRLDRPIERTEVESVIRKFMDKRETKEMRRRVEMLKDAANKAAAPGGSSYCNLEAFIEGLSFRWDEVADSGLACS